MKKSLVSLVLAMLVLGAVAGASYALFTDRTQVKGMSFSTGNADLKIGNNDITPGEHDELDYPENDLLTGIYPGYLIGDKFRLLNRSESDISLMVQALISEVDGDWNDLKSEISGRVIEYGSATEAETALAAGNPGTSGAIVTDTDWQTLQWWYNNSPEIVTDPIDQNGERHFVLWLKVDEEAGNEIAGKSLGLDVEFIATQVLE